MDRDGGRLSADRKLPKAADDVVRLPLGLLHQLHLGQSALLAGHPGFPSNRMGRSVPITAGLMRKLSSGSESHLMRGA
jgi:hypothetical protein